MHSLSGLELEVTMSYKQYRAMARKIVKALELGTITPQEFLDLTQRLNDARGMLIYVQGQISFKRGSVRQVSFAK